MRESIEQIDINFTNAGQGHTASITTVQDAKNLDGSDGLGSLIGEFGEINEFSNEDINRAMQNFICVNKTVNATPTRTSVNRTYIDKTSLTLDSIVVLVRGLNAAPEGDKDFQGKVCYYSEVKNSPRTAFASKDPIRKGHIIYAGRIYNEEVASKFNGVKISLVYQNKQIKENLSLNYDGISESYKANPDFSEYDLKYGYTLNEFKKIVELAGLTINGLPTDNADDILFELSGTLTSVLSGIASYLGYFYYINPENGFIEFVNTDSISQTKLTDYIQTTDKDIIQASFTRSGLTNKIVNSYVGSTEKPEKKSPNRDERPRSMFFKRVFIEKLLLKEANLTQTEVGLFFSLFNLGLGNDLFDKLVYSYLIVDQLPVQFPNINFAGGNDPLYLDELKETPPVKYFFAHKNNAFAGQRIHGNPEFFKVKEAAKKTNLVDDVGNKLDRIKNEFMYYKLSNEENKVMSEPSGSRLFKILQAYFKIAGGVYVSNAYSEYKVERMEFLNTNNINVVGPFRKTDKVGQIPELAPIADALLTLELDPDDISVGDLADNTGPRRLKAKAVGSGQFHFIGIRTITDLEKTKSKNERRQLVLLDKEAQRRFEKLKNFTEYYNPADNKNPSGEQIKYFGGPTKVGEDNVDPFFRDFEARILAIGKISLFLYKKLMEAEKGQVRARLSYRRSRTRINPVDQDEAEEDDALAESNTSTQIDSDLFDRFDFKFFATDSPENYDLMTKVTHSSANGSAVDMKLLRQIRGSMFSDDVVPESSSRTIYGLNIPEYTPTLNGISISVGANGVTTTINESTIELIPPDQTLLLNRAHEAILAKDGLRGSLSAKQLNFLGL